MIPILLHAHTRALTKIIYNADGDLLFSASKDNTPSIWYSHNGERLGTLKGHSGAVWTLAVSTDSRTLLSGSADNSCRVWDVETGRERRCFETRTAVRGVCFKEEAGGSGAVVRTGDLIALITDATMGHKSSVKIYDCRQDEPVSSVEWTVEKAKPTVISWYDNLIITGHEDGRLVKWDSAKDNNAPSILVENKQAHSEVIRDLQWSRDRTYFITASRDCSAKIFDVEGLKAKKCYKTERPVNAASISPLRHEVIVAGGQEALQVTTTGSRAGQFEARFFDQLLEREIGRVKGHFGPINTLTYHPTGRGYASGGEDGYVRMHVFDADYFDFKTLA